MVIINLSMRMGIELKGICMGLCLCMMVRITW